MGFFGIVVCAVAESRVRVGEEGGKMVRIGSYKSGRLQCCSHKQTRAFPILAAESRGHCVIPSPSRDEGPGTVPIFELHEL